MNEQSLSSVIETLASGFLPGEAVGIEAVINFHLSGEGGGDWVMKIQDQICCIAEGAGDNPRLVFSAKTQDCYDIFSGKLSGMAAYMQGKMMLEGDTGFAMKLTKMFRL